MPIMLSSYFKIVQKKQINVEPPPLQPAHLPQRCPHVGPTKVTEIASRSPHYRK
jgi:hypothetical protein